MQQLWLTLFALALPGGLDVDDRIALAGGVAFVGTELAPEVSPGATLSVDLYYTVEAPLEADIHHFLHAESTTKDSRCRVVRDVQPSAAEGGVVRVHVELQIPEGRCEGERLELYGGLYNRRSGRRLEVVGDATIDDRLHVGWVDVVASSPETTARALSVGDLWWHRVGRHLEAWWGWILWTLSAAVAAVALRQGGRWLKGRRRGAAGAEPAPSAEEAGASGEPVAGAPGVTGGEVAASVEAELVAGVPDEPVEPVEGARDEPAEPAEGARVEPAEPVEGARVRPAEPTAWLPEPAVLSGRTRAGRGVFWGTLALLAVPLLASLLAALDFIKDDAYISFRYAHNLLVGEGLVFNPGERLEGFTNFLWTLLLVPFEALGLDLFQVTEVLGGGLAAGLLVQLVFVATHMQGRQRNLSHLWGAAWLATSSSLALWSTSGLEQPLAMLLPVSSAYLLWTGLERGSERRALWSGVVMALACMTRPELHLIGIVIGLPLVGRVVWRRRIDGLTRRWFAGLLALTVPFHLFRVLYFDALLPNTFYVKTGASSLIMLAGLDKLHEMFDFNHLGWLVVLAPLAFIDGRRLLEKLSSLLIVLGFMAYVVKVGVDEMRWHRLYLPALPFLCLLAAQGVQNACRVALGVARRLVGARARARLAAAVVVYGLAWGGVAWAGWVNFDFTHEQMNGFNGRGDLSGAYHPDLGKFLTRHERPGGLVAFQDMGSTPYHAPDIAFLDFIGLVDRTVARARYAYGLNAFAQTEASRRQPEYDAEMRAYFYERAPEWVILTTYIPGSQAERVGQRFEREPGSRALEPWIGNNRYQFGVYDEAFKERYVHVRTWPRSRTYYLSLFRRRDLWEQTPGEVVLEGAPPGVGGVRARFEGGLELLGSEVEAQAIEHHEAFFTTWWRVPGPMPADTFFFVHVWREGYQTPYDHIPGDWMYPADRWQAGQVIEDRVLFQLPTNMGPGEYTVSMGVYRRATGERLRILEGPDDGSGRLTLGTLTVEPLEPPWHHLIPPTDVDEQRRYPERLIEHGRR